MNLTHVHFTDGIGQSATDIKRLVANFPFRFDIPTSFSYFDAADSMPADSAGDGTFINLCTSAGYVAQGSYGAYCDQDKKADYLYIIVNNRIFDDEYTINPGEAGTTPPKVVNVSFSLGPVAKTYYDTWTTTGDFYEARFLFQDNRGNTVDISVDSQSQETATSVLSQITVTGK